MDRKKLSISSLGGRIGKVSRGILIRALYKKYVYRKMREVYDIFKKDN